MRILAANILRIVEGESEPETENTVDRYEPEPENKVDRYEPEPEPEPESENKVDRYEPEPEPEPEPESENKVDRYEPEPESENKVDRYEPEPAKKYNSFSTERIESKAGKTFYIIPYQSIPIEDTSLNKTQDKVQIYFETSGFYHEYDRVSAACYLGFNPKEAAKFLPKHIAYMGNKKLSQTFMNIIDINGYTMSIEEVAAYHNIIIQSKKPQCRNYTHGSCTKGSSCNYDHANCSYGKRCNKKYSGCMLKH
jgi:hypothetical protein